MRALLLLSIVVFIISSCKQEAVKNDVASDEELHIAINRDPNKLHPYVYPVARAREVYEHIFSYLADFHPETYELTPIMIKDIPQPQEITEGPYKGKIGYEIELVENATWGDGSPITGEDYLFSIKSILHPQTDAGGYRSYFTDILDVLLDPENNRKVTIIFNEYYMLASETVSTLQIYPKHIYDPGGRLDDVAVKTFADKAAIERAIVADTSLVNFANDFNSVKYTRNIVEGAGPYKLVDWVPDQLIVLERKENYWGANSDIPHLQAGPKKIIYHIIPDELTVINQLKEGQIDVYAGASASAYNELKNNETYGKDFKYMSPEVMKTYFIMLNNTRPELQDKDVRRALAHLVDVEEIITLVEEGLAVPATGLINVNKSTYNEVDGQLKVDVEKSKNILQSEGWADSNDDGVVDKVIDGKQTELELDMHTTGSNISNTIALVLAENAKKAGVKINIIQKKYSLFRKENLGTLDYDMFTSAITQSLATDDPYGKWHSDNAPAGGSNQSAYISKHVDELIEKIRDTQDLEARQVLYRKLQEVMYEDQPVIWLYHPKERIILSKKWNGKGTAKRPGYLANTFTPAN